MASNYRVPKEGSTTVRRVEAAARRVLQGAEINWHADILAKVGGVSGEVGWEEGEGGAGWEKSYSWAELGDQLACRRPWVGCAFGSIFSLSTNEP